MKDFMRMPAAMDNCLDAAGIFIFDSVIQMGYRLYFANITKQLNFILNSCIKFMFRVVLFWKILYDITRIRKFCRICMEEGK